MHKNPEMQDKIERALAVSKKLYRLVKARNDRKPASKPRPSLKVVKK